MDGSNVIPISGPSDRLICWRPRAGLNGRLAEVWTVLKTNHLIVLEDRPPALSDAERAELVVFGKIVGERPELGFSFVAKSQRSGTGAGVLGNNL
jgi:hypothetical protein